MAAKRSSLRDLAAKAKTDTLAAANTGSSTGRIFELDPGLVHSGGLSDRLEVDPAELTNLAESLKTMGQKVPILVRPHPQHPGEYQIVAGRRRLAACRQAGLPVRAEIQDVDQHDLVLGQAIENIARENLSYIERARLAARMVDEAGIQPPEIDIAFSCGKTDRSRYLKIGRGVSNDILEWIGKAPSVGRPRWEKLVSMIDTDEGAEGRVRRAIEAANPEADKIKTSDQRFDFAFKAATPPPYLANGDLPKKSRLGMMWPDSLEKSLGTVIKDQRGVHVKLSRQSHKGLADWVFENPNKVAEILLSAYAQEMPEDVGSEKLAAANPKDNE
jgi:ParB family chromosome partitioning protein